MPRDSGTGVYTIPTGTHGITGTPVPSAPYNTYVDDVAIVLNTPLPVSLGGTGATTPAGAQTALNGETTNQVITNFSTNTLFSGSFSAAGTASNSPVAGHAFAGIIYRTDANNMVIEARDANDSIVPGTLYVREKKAGTWGAWTAVSSPMLGNNLIGSLTVNSANTTSNADLILNKLSTAYTVNADVIFQTNGVRRWRICSGWSNNETGGDVGADFEIFRSHDSGTELLVPTVYIIRATGEVDLANNLVVGGTCSSTAYLTHGLLADGTRVETGNLVEMIETLQVRLQVMEKTIEKLQSREVV